MIKKSVMTLAALLASPPTFAASAIFNYSFTTTAMHGATDSLGGQAPVATLTLNDRVGGGVDFVLSTSGINRFGPSAGPDGAIYVSGLFLLPDDDEDESANNLDMTDWTFDNASGDDAEVSNVEFGEDEEPNGYRYLIEVNFQRPLSGGSDALIDGETVQWSFAGSTGGGVSVANLLANSFGERDEGGSGPTLFSTLKLRGVPANGFWGDSDVVFGLNTVHVGAPVPVPAALPLLGSALTALFGWSRQQRKSLARA